MKILSKISGIYVSIFFIISVSFVIIFFYILPNKMIETRRIWAKFIKKLCMYKIEILGEIDEEAQMIILNHRSMLDIVVLEEIYPKNLAWIAKKQIGDLFFFGQVIKKPKMISIDRENARDFIRVINEAKDRLENGRVIAMFPEGTRSPSYELLRFKKGATMLASKLKLKVQPIVIIGSREILDSQKLLANFNKVIKIIPLKTIEAENLENARDLMQEAINEYFKENK